MRLLSPVSLLGLISLFTRFTVGQEFSPPPPFSLLAIPHGNSPLVPHIPNILDIPVTYESFTRLFSAMHKPTVIQQENHPSCTSGNNLLPTGNRAVMSKKPATESSVAQGKPECEEVLFLDQQL